jgi:AraC-like DNA-binding protein
MYTGYIVQVLHLVDFSEPFALVIGPLFYLFVISMVNGIVPRKKILLHLIFPALYTVTQIPFLISTEDVKYNAYIIAYHPELPLKHWKLDYDPWMFILTEWHTELVLLSITLYLFLSIWFITRSFRARGESFWSPDSQALKTIRAGIFQIAAFSVVIFVVKLFNVNDTGDHLLAAFGALLVYATSFSVINRSGFFKQASLTEQTKYKSSSLTTSDQHELIQKLEGLLKTEKPFLQPDFSLAALAKLLRVTPHILSQAINDGLGKSFFELTAEYRIEEAKNLLIEQPNIKIEEIAEQVGYSSKSSFNTAFKKITGKTPSEFRK